jgi:hypothetical protein
MAKASGFVFFFTSDRLNDFDGALHSHGGGVEDRVESVH